MGDIADEKRPILAADGDEDDKPTIIKPKRLIVVEPLLFLYALAGFPMWPLISQFTYMKVAETMGPNYTNLSTNNDAGPCNLNTTSIQYIRRQEVQAQTAQFNIYLSLIRFLPDVMMTMFWGAYSDRAGRKLLMILPCIGAICQSLVYMAVIQFNMNIYFLFLSPLVEGSIGSMGLIIMATMAYIADTVPVEKRALRMSVLEATTFISGAFSLIGVGYWIQASGFFWPFLFVIGGKSLVILYVIFLVPETIRKKQTSKSSAFSINLFTKTARSIFKEDGSGRRWKIWLIVGVNCLTYIVSTMSIDTLFQMNTPLCWTSIEMGYYSGARIAIVSVGSLIGAKVLRIWFSEATVGSMAFLSEAAERIFTGFVISTLMMFFVPAFGLIAILSSPMSRAILSRSVGVHEQTTVFAAMSVVERVFGLVNSFIINNLYSATLFISHGFVYFIAGGVDIIGALFFAFMSWKIKQENIRKVDREDKIIN